MKIYYLDSPNLYVRLEMDDNGVVIKAPDVIKHIVGWKLDKVKKHGKRKKWKILEYVENKCLPSQEIKY